MLSDWDHMCQEIMKNYDIETIILTAHKTWLEIRYKHKYKLMFPLKVETQDQLTSSFVTFFCVLLKLDRQK